MGRKPFLGVVSAFCVGLALTGCRDAEKRQEGPVLSKNNAPAYKATPAFGQNASTTDTKTTGWNTAPPSKTGAGTARADSPPPLDPSMDRPNHKPVDALTTSRTGSSSVQTTGAMGPLTPPPPPPLGSGETSSHFTPASSGEIHSVPGASGQTVLPPVPALASDELNMPIGLPEPPPPPPVKADEPAAPPARTPAVAPVEPALPPMPEPFSGALPPPPPPPAPPSGALPPAPPSLPEPPPLPLPPPPPPNG